MKKQLQIPMGFFALVLCTSVLPASQPPQSGDMARSGVVASDGLIRDAGGRIDYMVKLEPEAPLAYAKQLTHASRFAAFHKPEVVNAVRDIENYYGFRAHGITSLTIPTFSAFLDANQVTRLQHDPRIASVDPNQRWTFSISSISDPNAVWKDRIGPEVVSWGKIAINSSSTPSNGNSIVYVLDAGVGQHEDLNVVERVNAMYPVNDCGSRIGVPCTPSVLANVVGCYTHATAAAGVIGAIANGKGTQGINPGVDIVSVAASDTQLKSGASCVATNLDSSAVAAGLEWIANDIAKHPSPYTAVINMSINPEMSSNVSLNGSNTTVSEMMYALAHPTTGKGAFIAQAAGNDYRDACLFAYNPSNLDSPASMSGAALPSDGIMVVGAINNHGQPVVNFGSQFGVVYGFWKDAAAFEYDTGSNFGKCVDIWAPGDGIYMPVANPGSSTAQQDAATVYTTYGEGSGTSFSAPHIAGLASVLIERNFLASPSSVESAVRSIAYPLGSVDTCDNNRIDTQYGVSPGCVTPLPIMMPSLNPLSANAASKPYGELSLKTYNVNGTTASITVNGYKYCDETSPTYANCGLHNYTGDPPGNVTAQGNMWINFFASGGACSVDRTTAITDVVTFIKNKTADVQTAYWNSGTGSPYTNWSVSSSCLPMGLMVKSQGGSMKVSPNPVPIPTGQSTSQFSLTWSVVGFYPQGVTLYGEQNLGTNPNQILCLGSSTATSGTVTEPITKGETAKLWLTPNSSCTPGNVVKQLPQNIIDTATMTTD